MFKLVCIAINGAQNMASVLSTNQNTKFDRRRGRWPSGLPWPGSLGSGGVVAHMGPCCHYWTSICHPPLASGQAGHPLISVYPPTAPRHGRAAGRAPPAAPPHSTSARSTGRQTESDIKLSRPCCQLTSGIRGVTIEPAHGPCNTS